MDLKICHKFRRDLVEHQVQVWRFLASTKRRNRSCQQHIVYTMQLKKANPHQLCSGKPEDDSCLTILNSFASGVRLNRSISNNLNPHDSFYQKKNARKC